MGNITDYQRKLIESYKKGFDKIRELDFKTLTKELIIKYTIDKEEIKTSLPIGTVVLNCDEVLLTNWLKLVEMVDNEYKKSGQEFINKIYEVIV